MTTTHPQPAQGTAAEEDLGAVDFAMIELGSVWTGEGFCNENTGPRP